jgi:hypothetical protein
MMEQLKNQPFPFAAGVVAPATINGADIPDITPGVDDVQYNRTWTITLEPLTNPPNRLARVRVTVTWGGQRPQTVVLESMRAE